VIEDLETERRVAGAVLAFLRDQPLGDGAGFRSWVAMTNPFDDRTHGGVDLLTFHAAKGREWHTVFVTGVESSLVPHKSASTAAGRAEEGRLLYVAMTRAADRLVITSAERRRGYGRTPSPFIAAVDFTEPAATPPPTSLRHRRVAPDPLLALLKQWRDDAARRAGILPEQICGDRDLNAIARHRPIDADALERATTFGSIMAERLAEQIVPIVRAADDQSKSTMTGA
jgi:DNA helicase-2/ATP-dependent DNA helicase PcrA